MRFKSLALIVVIPIFLGMAIQRSGPREIMARMVDPAANFIWKSVSTTITSQGTEEKIPQNESEWIELRSAANLLAEGGRLLKKDPQREGDKDWLKWSQAIVDSATLTLEAIESKNANQVLEAGGAIYDTCVGCHGGYWRMSSP
jgi:hypothetical protein